MIAGEPLDRLELITGHWDVLADLIGAADDLHTVSGDSLALLMDLLVEEQRRALAEARLEIIRKPA
jgi:hypothetical protein